MCFSFLAAYWGSWGSYGSCSKSCGSGTKTRSRSCYGNSTCAGESSQSGSCTHGTCGKFILGGKQNKCSDDIESYYIVETGVSTVV